MSVGIRPLNDDDDNNNKAKNYGRYKDGDDNEKAKTYGKDGEYNHKTNGWYNNGGDDHWLQE